MDGVFEDFDHFLEDAKNPEGLTDVSELPEQEGLTGELRTDVPGVEKAIVYGDPEATGEKLDSVQGDAVEGALGTCGLTSAANVCQLAGKDITEEMTVEYALENGLCRCIPGRPEKTGGMTCLDMETLMEDFCGLDVHWETRKTYDLEDIAQDVIDGKGVIFGGDAGVLWGEPSLMRFILGRGIMNHYVTVTGVAVDAQTGEVAGLYICDSGGFEACRYVSAETFEKTFEKSIGANVIITDEPIRA